MRKIKFFLGVGVFWFCLLGTALSSPDGRYEVEVRGTNRVFLEGGVRVERVRARTTIKISSQGERITLEFKAIPGVHAATLFKGVWRGGEFVAVWWYRGYPYQTKVVWGRISRGRIEGQMIYPRVAEDLVPGYLHVRFVGKLVSSKLIPKKLLPPQKIPQKTLSFREDCIPFRPEKLRLRRIQGRWTLIEDGHYLLAFGDRLEEARRALRIIRHYGFNEMCFVGRPGPSMIYWLVDHKAPAGRLPGEDCVSFDPQRLEVKLVNGRWKIVEDSHWLMDFGSSRSEAEKALEIIQFYGFRHYCFVGRPGPSFKYWKR